MNFKKNINVGIGFATGRKSFQKVLKTYIHNWEESGLVDNHRIRLNLFIAYDLTYNKTKTKDYTNVSPELREKIDDIEFIGQHAINEEIKELTDKGILTSKEAGLVFGKGYAANRNIVLYKAIKHRMDYLIFLDDE